tara:strand:- start:588 stop:1106 length:519 start_codon:yes stop_codon:yes gene_type:complete
MFAIISNGVIALFVPAGTAFEWDSIQYPNNWVNLSSPEEKSNIGMVDVVYGQYPNDQYYWISQDAPVYADGVVTIGYTATPKDLTQCQTQAVDATNAAAYSILLPTDWMVVKAVETGGTVAPAWNTWRQTIRTQAADYIAAINGCTTVDQLAALAPVQWELDPNQPVTPVGV